MTFTIRIDCDNEAFTDNTASEIVTILHRLCGHLPDEWHAGARFTLTDNNGNNVGQAEVEP